MAKIQALLPDHPFARLLTAKGTRDAFDGAHVLLREFIADSCREAPREDLSLYHLSHAWRSWLLVRDAPPIWYVPRGQAWLTGEIRSLGFRCERGRLLGFQFRHA